MRAKIAEHKVGDTTTLTISRDGREKTVDVTLKEAPKDNNQ